MTSFAEIDRGQIRFDCRYYTGYKPCHRHDGCPGCAEFAPRGEQLLIIKLGAMGDVLRTKAILPALKRQHPESWIVWMTNPGSEALVRDPLVDEIRALTPEGLLSLEGRRFSKLFCFDKDPHALALSRKVDAGRRYGFAPSAYNSVDVWNESSMYALRLGLSDELKYRRNSLTAPQIVAEMAEVDYQGERYQLQTTPASRERAEALFHRLGIGGARPVVGLNTGCGPVFATKGWPVERMMEFVAKCAGEGFDLLLLGGERERLHHAALMEAASRHGASNVRDAGTGNSLEDFFAIVDRCNIVLTADSLALHVAVALGRPVVAWFGPTCEKEIDLFGLGEKLVTDFSCSPCYLKSCPKEIFCLGELTAKEVLEATRRVLAGASASTGAPR